MVGIGDLSVCLPGAISLFGKRNQATLAVQTLTLFFSVLDESALYFNWLFRWPSSVATVLWGYLPQDAVKDRMLDLV